MGWLALAALPWGTILQGAAELLKQANERRAASPPPGGSTASDSVEALRQRVARLEEQQRVDGELMQRLASQLAAIGAAAQATEAATRRAYLLAILGVAFGVLAALVGWFR